MVKLHLYQYLNYQLNWKINNKNIDHQQHI